MHLLQPQLMETARGWGPRLKETEKSKIGLLITHHHQVCTFKHLLVLLDQPASKKYLLPAISGK